MFTQINDNVKLSTIRKMWADFANQARVHCDRHSELDRTLLLVADLEDGSSVECRHHYTNTAWGGVVPADNRYQGAKDLPENWVAISYIEYAYHKSICKIIARKNKTMDNTATVFPIF